LIRGIGRARERKEKELKEKNRAELYGRIGMIRKRKRKRD
jgi:hypothetical protein